MLKLSKLYIRNFKGVSSERIIDFGTFDLNILCGPNGFGKTTIFDAIELCLRGKIERTEQFNKIQKNNRDYKKAFYQNTAGADVVIKVMFKDDVDDKAHIFVKYLNHEHDGRIENNKAFRTDSWGILETFYSNEENHFGSQFDIAQYQEITQSEIDRLFYVTEGLGHQSLFPLFNYLQQEENIYFLKKDEEEKKAQLDFLFQTEKESFEIEQLASLGRNLRSVNSQIKDNIKALGSITSSGEAAGYIQLFPEQQFAYDKVEPFQDIQTENLSRINDAYMAELDRLKEFVSAFDIGEFKKDQLRAGVVYVRDNQGMLNSFILSDLLKETKQTQLNELARKRIEFKLLLESIVHDEFKDSLLIELGFDDDFVAQYRLLLASQANMNSLAGTTNRLLHRILGMREELVQTGVDLGEAVNPKECLLCGTAYEEETTLVAAILEKTEMLTSFNRDTLTALDILQKQIISDFRTPVLSALDGYLNSPANLLDDVFYSVLVECKGFVEPIARFQAFLGGFDVAYTSFILNEPVSHNRLLEIRNELVSAMNSTLSENVPDESRLIHKALFKELFGEKEQSLISVEEIESKIKYVSNKFDEARLFSINKLMSRSERLETLEGRISSLKDSLSGIVRAHKLEMVEKIKIPFFLFSGKILQNYQQGFGIFIEMKQNTNRVKFLTDNESDHDIIHHLSSGQLAVVSIAFCLALNKVYQTTNHFKFLGIDDPVQTLDDINVHSFIELMRHEFKDYQIVISTHDDDVAGYLNYKFSGFNFSTNKINVQERFYN